MPPGLDELPLEVMVIDTLYLNISITSTCWSPGVVTPRDGSITFAAGPELSSTCTLEPFGVSWLNCFLIDTAVLWPHLLLEVAFPVDSSPSLSGLLNFGSECTTVVSSSIERLRSSL